MRVLSLAAFLALAVPSIAFAHSASGTLNVTAAVLANCAVQSPQAVDFGSYDPSQATQSPVDISAADALQISCTKGAPDVAIGLDNGQNYTGTHRAMTAGGADSAVYYELYTTPARTVVWNRISTVAYVPTSRVAVRIPLYGRVVGAHSPHPGRYTDTLVAMVNF